MKIIGYNDCIKYDRFASISHDFYGNHANPCDYCEYCNNKMVLIKEIHEPCIAPLGSQSCFDARYDNDWYVTECKQCGWWQCIHNFQDFSSEGNNEAWIGVTIDGIVKSFNASDKLLPITVLNSEVKKNPQILYYIHDKKFEEFVKDVFSDFFSCNVIHCGKTGDGGIDLMIIESDTPPILVQVKRRQKLNFTEPIKDIKEFLGTMMITQSKQGIYVTTAKRFSKNTKIIRQNILDKRIVERFEIFNFDQLISIFNLSDITFKPWIRFFDGLISQLISYTGNNIYNKLLKSKFLE